MVPNPDDRLDDDGRPPPDSSVFEAILENERNRRYLGERLDVAGNRVNTDLLGDIVRHGPVLEVLLEEPLNRREIEACLDISRTTSHRYTQWLDEQGFVEKVHGRFQLTWRGAVIAEEILRFKANVRTASRSGVILDAVREDHRGFILEPFVDATITIAEPNDPSTAAATRPTLLFLCHPANVTQTAIFRSDREPRQCPEGPPRPAHRTS